MSIKPGPFAIAAATLIGVLSGCGTSSDTSGSAVSTTTSAASSPSSPSSTAAETPTSTSPSMAPKASPSASKSVLITIQNFKYTVPMSVAPGSKVTVKNADSENHTVTSATPGAFAVQADAGGTATFTAPTKPGSYPFTCTFHGTMTGKLVVK